MRPREILDRTTTPDGEPLELAREGGHFVLRVGSAPLMSSAAFGSEVAMARVARELVGDRGRPRVLVGGLGMGFTLRAALDAFGSGVQVTVAELLEPLVRYNRGVLAELHGHALDDPRVRLYQGDVRVPLEEGGFDVVLMDVDNGPDAFTARSNAETYTDRGAERLARALRPGGVLVVWSAYPSKRFERSLARAGLRTSTRRVSARQGSGAGGRGGKGGKHILFIGQLVSGRDGDGGSGSRARAPGRGRRSR